MLIKCSKCLHVFSDHNIVLDWGLVGGSAVDRSNKVLGMIPYCTDCYNEKIKVLKIVRDNQAVWLSGDDKTWEDLNNG